MSESRWTYDQYAAEIQRLQDALARVAREAVPQWTSVKDEMPKPYVDVLVYGTTHTYGREHTFMRQSYYCGDDDGYFFCEDTDTSVSHWMPLPPPPISEDNTDA